MISDGLVDEVKSLLPYANDSKALSTAIGYKEIISYLEGDCTLEEAISLIQKKFSSLCEASIHVLSSPTSSSLDFGLFR